MVLEVLTSTAFLDALILTVVGIVLYNVVGWLKNTGKFELRKVASTSLIAFVLSLPIIMTQLSLIDLSEAGELAVVLVIFGIIAQVAGIEKTVRNIKEVAVAKLHKSN